MVLITFASGEYALWRRWDWQRLLELAHLGGWSPRDPDVAMLVMECRYDPGARVFRGVDPPLPRRSIEIDDRDAAALAGALERVLPDIPNHDCAAAKAPAFRDVAGHLRERCVLPGQVLSPFEDFSGGRKALLRELAGTVRRGGAFTVRALAGAPRSGR